LNAVKILFVSDLAFTLATKLLCLRGPSRILRQAQ
jgi:hypothetical protein